MRVLARLDVVCDNDHYAKEMYEMIAETCLGVASVRMNLYEVGDRFTLDDIIGDE